MLRKVPQYIPKRAVFEATLACNLRCKHCGSRAGKARPDELSCQEAGDMFQQLADLGCWRVSIAGGEPTVREDWLELIRLAHQAGLKVGMVTNGIRFSKEAISKAKANGLESAGLSLDGIGRIHDEVRGRQGHYDIVLRAAQNAQSVGLPISILTHINKLNYKTLPQMHDKIVEMGAFAWQVQLGTDMGNMSDHKELLIEPKDLIELQRTLAKLKQKGPIRLEISDSIGYFGPSEKQLRSGKSKCFSGCHAGLRAIGIESNGNVKGCLSIMAGYNERGKEFVEGNIREKPLAEIWNDPNAFAYNRQWSLDNLGGFCKECKHARKCRGGCTAKRVASGEGLENPLCAYQVISKQTQVTPHKGGLIAASVLAGAISTAGAGCYTVSEDELDSVNNSSEVLDYSDTPYSDSTDNMQLDYSDSPYEYPTDNMETDYSDTPYEYPTESESESDTDDIQLDYSDAAFYGDTD